MMARKRLVPVNKQRDPDYYLHGRERRIRREAWEWPEHERHPVVGVTRVPYREAWRVNVGSPWDPTSLQKSFSDSVYGGSQAALEAAIACRTAETKKRPGYKCRGWKLSPNQAGAVVVDENRKNACAALTHDGALCRQYFSWGPRSGRTKEHAIELAEMALEIWREEALRIAKMPRYKQERIAASGGWTQRKGFPMTREQMDLPLDG